MIALYSWAIEILIRNKHTLKSESINWYWLVVLFCSNHTNQMELNYDCERYKTFVREKSTWKYCTSPSEPNLSMCIVARKIRKRFAPYSKRAFAHTNDTINFIRLSGIKFNFIVYSYWLIFIYIALYRFVCEQGYGGQRPLNHFGRICFVCQECFWHLHKFIIKLNLFITFAAFLWYICHKIIRCMFYWGGNKIGL